ncbi:MAG: S49 family peptidase [Burkholderiaceae bacterium]|nr:S49 family peptidase [Burkholderiaceae bacterium]
MAYPDAPRRAPAAAAASDAVWQRRLIEDLAREALVERRRARRWTIFFRLLGIGVVLLLLAIGVGWFQPGESSSSGRHTALIEIDGVIAYGGEVDADMVNAALRNAFEDRQTAAVVMRINSPGGSPVQAGRINDEVRRLRKLYPAIPLYAVVEEICASGGYYLAAAADRIFVDKASLVGSIGVVIEGFGLTGLMDKAGVERRLLTAGRNKGFLDPFLPVAPEQRAHAQAMLNEVHQQFIRVVRDGRGARLKESPELFSGLFWTGERSIELGLADELGSLASVARDVVKAEDIVDFTRRGTLVERLAKRMGASVGAVLAREAQVGAEPRLR